MIVVESAFISFDRPNEFTMDHPFYYVVKSDAENMPLFVGKVENV